MLKDEFIVAMVSSKKLRKQEFGLKWNAKKNWLVRGMICKTVVTKGAYSVMHTTLQWPPLLTTVGLAKMRDKRERGSTVEQFRTISLKNLVQNVKVNLNIIGAYYWWNLLNNHWIRIHTWSELSWMIKVNGNPDRREIGKMCKNVRIASKIKMSSCCDRLVYKSRSTSNCWCTVVCHSTVIFVSMGDRKLMEITGRL